MGQVMHSLPNRRSLGHVRAPLQHFEVPQRQMCYRWIPENCVARIVLAPRIKFRFKLRLQQSDTINTIIDKLRQHYVNISSRTATLKVKKLECQKHAIPQNLIPVLTREYPAEFKVNPVWDLFCMLWITTVNCGKKFHIEKHRATAKHKKCK